jgi:tetratricopeptide (TPR) repeat protein
MAAPDDRRNARPQRSTGKRPTGGWPTSKRRSSTRSTPTKRDAPAERRTSTRDRANEGGFGPYGAPQAPKRERRPDQERPERPAQASRLRLKGERRSTTGSSTDRKRRAPAPRTTKRRRRAPQDVEAEILRLGGKRGPALLNQLLAAADDFSNGRDRDALNKIRRVRDALPDSPTTREMTGLIQYRLGNYRAAAKELEEFVRLTNAVEQHPVLMDSYRAQRRWGKVDELWEDLAATSPSAELVTEGRIVAAGARADQGHLHDAIGMLVKKAKDVKQPRDYHLRLWYALADLEERAGNLARARELFNRIRRHDADFADVTARVRALR